MIVQIMYKIIEKGQNPQLFGFSSIWACTQLNRQIILASQIFLVQLSFVGGRVVIDT
jgi:hypothetical protein